ncbi:MAG TPA: DMT family transporter [Actinomycetota bacterium]
MQQRERLSAAADAVGGVAAAASAFAFGSAVVLGVVATERGLPIPGLLAIRFTIAAAAVALVLASLRRSLRAAPGEGWWLLLLGGIGYGAEAGFFYLALQHGTAAAVSLLFFTYPVWVTVFVALMGRGGPGLLVGGSLAAAVAGAALVVASSGGLDIDLTGILLSFASAVTFAVYLILVDWRLRRTPSLVASMWVTAGAAVALALYALVSGEGRMPRDRTEWWAVVGQGVVTSAAFLGLFIGLKRLGPVRVSIVASLEPMATAILAFLVLGQAVRPLTALGGALIMGAAVTAALARGREKLEQTPP